MDKMVFNAIAELQPQEFSREILASKHAKVRADGSPESMADVRMRVATALAQAESEPARWVDEFYRAQVNGLVMGGRINAAAGTGLKATMINCFVQPVGDAMSGGANGAVGIYDALTQAAETLRRGGGVGYNFSDIRPKNAYVAGTDSQASGPLSFMKVFEASCETVESAGARRGAQMGIMRVTHPDIREFIKAKRTNGLKNFNISVGITAEFMQALQANGQVQLWHAAQPHPKHAVGKFQRDDGNWVYDSVPARELWDLVMKSTYEFADPGVVFLDRMNEENNLFYAEEIIATNPCGEIPLPAYGCCCLGSVILTRMVRNPFSEQSEFDFDALRKVVKTAVRMLDNVLDVTVWPLPQQQQEARDKRRVGLGFTGLANALTMLGVRYDRPEGRDMAARITQVMRDTAYETSSDLALEKGSFSKYDTAFLASKFTQRLPQELRVKIAAQGMRNSHLLSIAPTGTISIAFGDNCSSGIEPAFTWEYLRNVRQADGSNVQSAVTDYAYRLYQAMGGDVQDLPQAFVSAAQVSAQDHVAMVAAVQPFIDSAISKTVNVPADYPFADFVGLYELAWAKGIKGITTYRPNAVTGAVLVDPNAKPAAAAPAAKAATLVEDIDPLTCKVDGRPKGDLMGVTRKVEFLAAGQKQSLYVTVNFAEVSGVVDGKSVTVVRPIEVFVPAGQNDADHQWVSSNMRLLSMVARAGGAIDKAIENMKEVAWDKGPVRIVGDYVQRADGSQAPRYHRSVVAAVGHAIGQMLIGRGFLTAEGKQVPVRTLAQANLPPAPAPAPTAQGSSTARREAAAGTAFAAGTGMECSHCGAHDLHKVDGCEKCTNCGHIGSCG